jgi:hypothetical protein
MLNGSHRLPIAVVLTVLATTNLLAQDTDKAYFGTWKLNVAKSKFEPGPGPKELVRIHEDAGAGQIRITTKAVNQDGTAGSTVYTYRGDGKDNLITGGRGTPVMIAITAVDAYSVTYAQKLPDGRVVATGRRTLAKDGKNMTITATGTNPQGEKTSSTQVFEKQ